MKWNKSLWVFVILICLVYTASALTDSNLSNNVMNVSVNIQETDEIKLLFVPVENNGGKIQ